MVEFDRYAPYDADVNVVFPLENVLVPEYVAKAPGEEFVTVELTENAPPDGEYVPDVEEFVPALPADPLEKDLTCDFETSTADMLMLDADTVAPL